MSSGLKSNSKMHQDQYLAPYPDLLQSPPGSLSKRDIASLSRNKSAAKSDQKEEPTSIRKASIRSFGDAPTIAQNQARNFITMGELQIDPKITRVRAFRWVLLLMIKIVSVLAAVVFWLSSMIFFKTLVSWDGFFRLAYTFIRFLKGSRLPDGLWRFILIGNDYDDIPQLRLAVHASRYLHSAVLHSISIPLFYDSPFFWLFLMTLAFTSHHFLCFSHDCLSKLSPTMTAAD